MAERYFVAGGDGNWGSTNNWAATKAGASGETVPGASDNVYLTDVSPASLVVNTSGRSCLNFVCTGYIGEVSGTQTLTCYGTEFTLSSAMTWSHTGGVNFANTTGTTIITQNGKIFGGASTIGISPGTATFVFGSDFALVNTGSITFSYGTLDTAGYDVTCKSLLSNNANTRAIYLRNSTVTLTVTTAAACLDFTTTTGLTFDAGTSTIVVSRNTTNACSFLGGGQTFNNVVVNSAGTGHFIIRLSPTIKSLRYNNTDTTAVLKFKEGTTTTVGEFYAGGSSGSNVNIQSESAGTAATISCADIIALEYVTVKDITYSGGGRFFIGGGTSTSGNTGITFYGVDRTRLNDIKLGTNRRRRRIQDDLSLYAL